LKIEFHLVGESLFVNIMTFGHLINISPCRFVDGNAGDAFLEGEMGGYKTALRDSAAGVFKEHRLVCISGLCISEISEHVALTTRNP